MPGIRISSTYVAVPVISRGSSRLRMRCPMSGSILVGVVVAMSFPLLISRLRGRSLYRVHDVLVSRSSAHVACQAIADFFLGWMRIPVENLLRSHDHARR